MLLFARECPFVIDGALVLNGIAVAAKAAEMALALRRLTGAVVSRRGTYAKASTACVDEYLGIALVNPRALTGAQSPWLVSSPVAAQIDAPARARTVPLPAPAP